MKSNAKVDVSLPSAADNQEESPERLAARAVDGVDFGIAALRRMRRRLRKWLRPKGQIDNARAIAAVVAVQTALTTISPLHLAEMVKRIRRHQLPAGLDGKKEQAP